MKTNIVRLMLAAILLLGCFGLSVNAQDLGVVTGDIPGPGERATLESKTTPKRRAAPPKSLFVSQTPAFSGPSLRTIENLRQRTQDARRDKKTKVEGHYIVLFKQEVFPYEGKQPDGSRHLIAANGANVLDKITECLPDWAYSLISVYSGIGGFSALLTEQQAKALSRHPDIQSVEEESIVKVGTIIDTWSADWINQQGGNLDGSLSNRTGAGVHVYIIDSGISSSHAELSGTTISDSSACFIPSSDPNYNYSLDTSPFVDRSENNGTVVGHGTGVASIVAGQSVGIARGATLHSVRWTNTGVGGSAAIINCINWVASNYQLPAVANMSFGTVGGYNTSIDATTQALINAGVTVIAAAGNGDSNGNPVDASGVSPARVSDAITVAGTGQVISGTLYMGQGYERSNFGSVVDIVAPAKYVRVASTDPSSQYRYFDGTSLAAPAVAAVACHYLQVYPNATPEEVRNSIVINSTRNILAGLGSGTPNRLLYTGPQWINPDVIIVGGSGSLVGTNIAHPNGNTYDQVLMTGSSVTVHADNGQIIRCSWIDENDDIVQAEMSGYGNLTIELQNATGPAYPIKYNQSVNYMKGRAKLTLSGATNHTWVAAFSVGAANAVNQSLFIQGVTYDAKADIQSLDFVESTKLAGIGFGNVFMHSESGVVGINAPGVNVDVRAVFYDIDAVNSATAYLKFGDSSAFSQYSGRPVVAGGNLVQSNGTQIRIAESAFSQLYTQWNVDSFGNTIFAQTLASARLLKPSGSASLYFTTSAQAPGGQTYSGYTSY